jgi:hypothetical protein
MQRNIIPPISNLTKYLDKRNCILAEPFLADFLVQVLLLLLLHYDFIFFLSFLSFSFFLSFSLSLSLSLSLSSLLTS